MPNRSSTHPNTKTKTTTTALSYENEIIQSFQIFDEERSGTISINNFKLILRALGFRVTKHDVIRDVLESNKRRGLYQSSGNAANNGIGTGIGTDDNGGDFINDRILKEIDLETVLDVILYNPDSKYNRMNQTEEEIKMMHKVNFRLFDVENKGYITASNLKRAVQELREFSIENSDVGSFGLNQSFKDIDDDELKVMIEEFDGDQDGMINEDEFRKIMEFGL